MCRRPGRYICDAVVSRHYLQRGVQDLLLVIFFVRRIHKRNTLAGSMKDNGPPLTTKDTKGRKDENIELQELWKELGIPPKDGTALASYFDSKHASDSGNKLHPILALGIGVGVLFNIGILLSLPPVLRGRGKSHLIRFNIAACCLNFSHHCSL